MAVEILPPSTSRFSKSREICVYSLWSLFLLPSYFPNVFLYKCLEQKFSHASIFCHYLYSGLFNARQRAYSYFPPGCPHYCYQKAACAHASLLLMPLFPESNLENLCVFKTTAVCHEAVRRCPAVVAGRCELNCQQKPELFTHSECNKLKHTGGFFHPGTEFALITLF